MPVTPSSLDDSLKERIGGILLPDRVREVWKAAASGRHSKEAAMQEQARLTEEYASIWAKALALDGSESLEQSILTELGEYYRRPDPDAVRALCCGPKDLIADAWRRNVDEEDASSIDAFYDRVEVERYVHALMWWHTLTDDNSPLAYVVALEFARQHGCRSLLDFGTGSGSGTLLYAAEGMETAGADISEPMLAFTKWRLERRGLHADIFDLRIERLPEHAFDFVSAMDVFEHLSDPLATVDELARAIRPGGFLFGRFAVGEEDDHPLHIVRDFAPVFERLTACGFKEVWRDTWLWGHRAFAKGSR